MATPSYEIIKQTMRSEEAIERFAEVMGTHQARGYITSVLIAVQNSDQLQLCTPISIMTSAMRAATLRLSCDPSLGQAYLVPFKNKATLVIGYKGIKDMAIRTGRYRYLNCAKIWDGQVIEEDQLKGVHTITGSKKSDKYLGWLLYFELVTGYSHSLYMTTEEIHAHAAKYSKMYNVQGGTWKTETEKMEAKTVLRLGLSRYGYFDPADAQTLSLVESDETVDGEVADAEMETVVEDAAKFVKANAEEEAAVRSEYEMACALETPMKRKLGDLNDSQLVAITESKNAAIELRNGATLVLNHRIEAEKRIKTTEAELGF